MRLDPGRRDEYRRRHDALWPELAELLREAGISDYSIFLDETSNVLFAVLLFLAPPVLVGLAAVVGVGDTWFDLRSLTAEAES